MKSTVAARAAKGMNPNLNIRASETPVGPDTENEFNDDFWESFGVVVNALDNLKVLALSSCFFFFSP